LTPNSRSYITQFSQPDTIIPNPYNSLDWNRYGYARNNPVRYTDPSGHKVCDGAKEDGGECIEWNANYALSRYGIKIVGVKEEDKWKTYDAAYYAGRKLVPYLGGSSADAFKAKHGNIVIRIGTGRGPLTGNCETVTGAGASVISCESAMTIANAVHEFGHAFDIHHGLAPSNKIPSGTRSTEGLECGPKSSCVENTDTIGSANASIEEFADFYLNWVLDGVPGFDDYGLTDKTNTAMYSIYSRKTWWNSNILPMITP
jgi:hypothetical protein